jgi:acetyltransferase-like isoleucine patch superfamily enzyme
MSLGYIISKIIKKIQFSAVKNSDIDRKAKICSASHIVNSSLDRYSYIGNRCTVINADIGRFSSIADNCIIGGASHPINWVSTSPVFYKGRNILKKNFSDNDFISTTKTFIGNDVWIGMYLIV